MKWKFGREPDHPGSEREIAKEMLLQSFTQIVGKRVHELIRGSLRVKKQNR